MILINGPSPNRYDETGVLPRACSGLRMVIMGTPTPKVINSPTGSTAIKHIVASISGLASAPRKIARSTSSLTSSG